MEIHESRFDLHVHTGASSDASGTVEAIVAAAVERGLVGFAVTDHDTTDAIEKATELAKPSGLIVIPGVEVTAKNKWMSLSLPGNPVARIGLFPHVPHLLVYGIDIKTRRIPTLKSVREVGVWAHDQGALMIAAHPRKFGGLVSLGRQHIAHFIEEGILDGVETANRAEENPMLLGWATEQSTARTGGSDAHTPSMLGMATTVFDRVISSAQDVVEGIKEQKGIPFVPTPIRNRYPRSNPVASIVEKAIAIIQ